MRIIQVVNVRFFNATAWYGMTLAELLRAKGHEVLVLGLEGTESWEVGASRGLPMLGMNLNTTNPLSLAAMYRGMRALVRDFRPDVINCHRGESFVLWGLLKAQTRGFKLVRTRGDQRPPKNNLPNRLLHHRLADAVVATNSRMARHFVKEMGLPGDHVWTILGGVDKSLFRPDPEARARVRAEFGYGENDFVVGMVGRFDGVKGQPEMIEALARAYHGGRTNLRLLLIGFDTTISSEEVGQWCHEAGVDHLVRITGPRGDVPDCINALDLGVTASRFSETIARAPMEIMACGVPLLATDVGVLPDLVPPEGLLPSEDPHALARLLDKAASDPGYLESVRRGEQATMRQCGLDDFATQTLALYKGLAEESA
ncbi:glycosyltransferase family 4 protein [Desulfohalovibrio reitneri]|uniref:glycosyltransferase family 4 protein n=1 Tax=Desulfohalovibrio reitneri TaxID=1307759 RepID=UPI0004A769EC|nr:glycosyltransferase family 4 protein [Desulfohalovibrio reitneri]